MPETAITSLPLRLQRQVEQARTAFDRGNTEYAVNLCREILKEHPGCLAVRRLLRATQLKVFKQRNPVLARVFAPLKVIPAVVTAQAFVKKNPAAALIAAERGLAANPSHVGALRVLAEAALELDFPETAVFALESVREQQPAHRDTLVRLAEAYIAAGRSAEGLAMAEALMRESPGDAQLQELLKNASVAQSINAGRWESGSGTFRDKLRDEDEAVSLEQASRVVRSEAMTQRQIDETIARLRDDPANPNLHRSIVQGYRALGNFDEALQWLARARLLPTGAADVSLEKLESELRLARTAQRVEARAAAVAATGADPYTDAELARLRTEHQHTRLQELRAFVDKYPNDHAYKFDLGQLYRETGQLDLAIQQFQVVQRSPKLRIGALMQLGSCFQAKGLFDLAVQQFETAKTEIIAFDEQKKEAIYELGCCFEAMGRGERAVEEFKLIYSWDIGFRDVAAKIDRFYAKS